MAKKTGSALRRADSNNEQNYIAKIKKSGLKFLQTGLITNFL